MNLLYAERRYMSSCAVLIAIELAYLVDDCKAHLPATNAQRDHYVASREAAITEQKRVIASTASEKRKAMEAKYADKIASKRAERAAKKQAAQPQATPDQADPQAGLVQLSAPEPEKSSSTPTPPADSAEEDLSQVVYPVKIRGLSEGLPWYQPESYTYHSIDQARQAGVWTYPSNAVEEARCQVFEDLWQKGHFMGNGLRFGGSLLVYPGALVRSTDTSVPGLIHLHAQTIRFATIHTSRPPFSRTT